MSIRTSGRHAAPRVRPSSAVTVAAVSAAFGMTATAAVAAPAGETEATGTETLSLDLAPVATPSTIGVTLPEEASVELDTISVTSEEAPEVVVEEVVVEEAPVVEEAAPVQAEVQAAPVAETAVATTSETVEEAPAVAEPEAAAPVAPSANSNIVAIARQYAGVPYRMGGTTPAGWDCSGFTSYVYAQAGISLPRTSGAQRYAGTVVSAAQAQPGDLVWWPGHVGIYTGGGMHIAARNPAAGTAEGPVYGSPVYIRVG